VAFADTDFADAAWTASGFSEPAPAGAWHAEAQLTTAGNPGAWRRTNFELQTGPSRVRLYHDAPAMRYDPAASGAIYVVDVGEDCINADDNPVSRAAFTTPTIVQGARRYVASDSWWHYCGSTVWTRYERPSLQAGDFVLVDGPACAGGESCPDFGAAAAPLVFGYVLSAERPAGASGGSGAHGIDNLRITVWRR
jgi:hypothetical protein